MGFTKKINKANMKSFVARDRARAVHLANRHKQGKVQSRQSVDVTNEAVSYLAAVDVGSPATTYNLIIDTGSSNTWVGADTKYVKTSTSKSTSKKVSVSYGSGSFSGTEYTDQVAISDDLVISKQSIGVASKATGFEDVDGILGIGPVSLTEGTVSGVSSVPTVTDNLYSQGLISREVVSVSFEPPTEEEELNGELTFGGTDSSKYTGSITYTPVTSTSPANGYWGIDQKVTYNGASLLNSAGIVDTGTTLIYLATDAFNKYKSATGATADSATGLLKLTSTKFKALKPLNFVIGGTTFSLSANAQIWPRSLNTVLGGTSSGIYLVVVDLGSDSGEGLDFINGQAFLERFYSVYDTTNQRVGIANTPYTNATTN
ncbi:family A1 protease [Exidia glandulosa HHB12029]|uniref:Family A1 protease n=1 Tax=Exidia glandulosa HHB12029 TaxID=1314781 RepID=A0A165BD10_EXIGL|nr:family A1 protease [Exidia glandulosa HHB12029]